MRMQQAEGYVWAEIARKDYGKRIRLYLFGGLLGRIVHGRSDGGAIALRGVHMKGMTESDLVFLAAVIVFDRQLLAR